MNAIDIILLIAGFAVGASLGCLPDPRSPERKLAAVGVISFALGIQISLLAVAAAFDNFLTVLALQAIVLPTGWLAAHCGTRKSAQSKLASN